MTMGPAPIIIMVDMSVLFGISVPFASPSSVMAGGQEYLNSAPFGHESAQKKAADPTFYSGTRPEMLLSGVCRDARPMHRAMGRRAGAPSS